jgi:TolB protein
MPPKSVPRWLLILLAIPALTCQTITGTQQAGGGTASAGGGQSQFPTPPPTARIAFVATGWSVHNSSHEIFVMNVDGTGITDISNSPDDDIDPTWSPDGTKIAFTSERDGNAEIYVMNSDGTDQRRLTDSPELDDHPGWSPDGTQIVFSRLIEAHNDLYIINSDGTGLTRLTDTADTSERYPDWSPDGKTIVFSAFGGGEAGIYTIRPDGSHEKLLMGGPLHSPQWSKDGKMIAFDGEPAGCKFEVYTMKADGSKMREITEHPMGCGGYDKHPSWSPDGDQLVFWSSNRDAAHTEDENLFLINADGSGETQLTHTNNVLNYGGYDPDWSPVP